MLESGMVGKRRAFLQEGSAAILSTAVGLGTSNSSTAASAKPAQSETPFNVDSSRSKKCILLFLHGGASQLETFDPKPHAPAHIRGPFDAVATSVPGVHFSENLPKLAMLADRFAVVRSLTWDGPATHAAGIELMQTGAAGGLSPHPTLGADICSRRATRWRDVDLPAAVVVGGCLQDVAGREILESANQILGSEWIPPLAVSAQRSSRHRADSRAEFMFQAQVRSGIKIRNSTDYGRSTFGENCQLAVQLVNAGVQFVTVNMFPQLHGCLSWDCHADGGDLPTSLQDYRDAICPQYDAGCAALLQKLEQTGQIDETLVVAVGEFGRTPRVNVRGGRGHWTRAWSALIAGGGTRGGAVLGSTDATAAEPLSRPVTPAELFSRMKEHLGMRQELVSTRSEEAICPIRSNMPLSELFN